MAVGDKLVTLDGLKAVYQDLNGNTDVLKSAVSDVDSRTNRALSYVNYGYDEIINYPIGDGTTWKKSIGIRRVGTTVTLNKTNSTASDIRIKLSGNFDIAANSPGVQAWNTGISLPANHKYRITCKLMSGTATKDDEPYYGFISVYRLGEASTVSPESSKTVDGVYTREFTAEENVNYNIVFYVYGDALFTDAEYLIVMEDVTFGGLTEEIQKLSEFDERADHLAIKPYDFSKDITDDFTFTNGKCVNYANGNNTTRAGASYSNFVSVEGFDKIALAMPYHTSELVNGLAFYTEPDVAGFISGSGYRDHYDTELASGTYEYRLITVPSGAKYVRTTWWATGSTEYSQVVPFMCHGITENGNAVPDYYFDNNYLNDKVAEINTINAGLSYNSYSAFFITDYHLEDNARKSPALISYLIGNTGIRNVVFGGDAINHSYGNKAGGIRKLCQFMEDFRDVREKGNMYLITGNHEMNNADNDNSAGELSKAVPFNLFNAPLGNKINNLFRKSNGSVVNTNTFYVDDDNARMRTYFVDCTSGGTIMKSYMDVIIPSLTTVPDGYSVLLFSHTGVGTYTSDDSTYPATFTITALNERFEVLMKAGKAMEEAINCTGNNAITLTIDGTTYTYTPDFTGKTRTFVGAVIGHWHQESYYIYEGRYPVIAVPCDTGAYNREKRYRVPFTTTEQAFDVLQVDLDTKRIYCTRIGFGSNRVFTFGENAGLITE